MTAMVEKVPPWVTILTPPDPHSKVEGRRSIVLAVRGYRSKWTRVDCFCRHARKDGTCKTLDQLVPLLAHPERVRFAHVPAKSHGNRAGLPSEGGRHG